MSTHLDRQAESDCERSGELDVAENRLTTRRDVLCDDSGGQGSEKGDLEEHDERGLKCLRAYAQRGRVVEEREEEEEEAGGGREALEAFCGAVTHSPLHDASTGRKLRDNVRAMGGLAIGRIGRSG